MDRGKFFVWLSKKISSSEITSYYFTIDIIERFAKEKHLIFSSLFELKRSADIDYLVSKIEMDSSFKMDYHRQMKQIISFMHLLRQYVLEHMNLDDEEKENVIIRYIDINKSQNSGAETAEEGLKKVLASLEMRYKDAPAKTLTEILKNNKDLPCSKINEWTKELFNKTAGEYLCDLGIIKKEEKKTKEEKDQERREKFRIDSDKLLSRYKNRKAYSLTEMAKDNPDVSFSLLNSFTREYCGITASQYLSSMGILVLKEEKTKEEKLSDAMQKIRAYSAEKKLESIAQISECDIGVTIATLKNWIKSIYGISLSEYLIKEGLLEEKKETKKSIDEKLKVLSRLYRQDLEPTSKTAFGENESNQKEDQKDVLDKILLKETEAVNIDKNKENTSSKNIFIKAKRKSPNDNSRELIVESPRIKSGVVAVEVPSRQVYSLISNSAEQNQMEKEEAIGCDADLKDKNLRIQNTLKAPAKMSHLIPKLETILQDKDLIKTSLSDLYSIDAISINAKQLSTMGFSVRLENRFKNDLKIITLGQLLELSFKKICQVRGLGKNCLLEIDDKLRRICETENKELEGQESVNPWSNSDIEIFRAHIKDIIRGDYSFLELQGLSSEDNLIIERIEQTKSLVDKDLLKKAAKGDEYLLVLQEMLFYEARKWNIKEERWNSIRIAYENIDEKSKKCKVEGLIFAYTDEPEIQDVLVDIVRKGLVKTLDEFIKIDEIIDDDYYSHALQFLKWCSFDLAEDIQQVLTELKKNEREWQVISLRAEGKTLEATGNHFRLTRERIRQIEVKAKRRFVLLQNRYRLILKIYAVRNQDAVLTPAELEEYFEDNTNEILYLLRSNFSPDYTYDKDLDVYVVKNEGLAERTQTYVDSLPEAFKQDKLKQFIHNGIEEYGLTEEILNKALEQEYRLTGKVYHRSRLSRAAIYEQTLKNHYPNGLWVYNKKSLQEFRKHILLDYGDIPLPSNDRALGAQVCRVAILCDRGTYKAKQKKYIPDDLAKDIHDYIDNSDQPIFLMNTIFHVFEDELYAVGVDNKYYLQGILHELYGEEWLFRRDYVSKDENVTTIYSAVISFIKKSKYPVKKEEIYRAFPGITDIVVMLSVGAQEIINLYGSYLHVDNLKIADADVNYLNKTLEKVLGVRGLCDVKQVYGVVSREKPEFLNQNYINIPFGLFSLLEHYFNDEYNFSRPYIARAGVEIERSFDVLREMVRDSDQMQIADIRQYAKDNYLQIANILEFLDSCNESHLLIDDKEIMAIDIIGLTAEGVAKIEACIIDEVKETIPISSLQCVNSFPKINVPWSEWLIYSAIKKWGTSFDVAPSAGQFRYAFPMIAPKGKMDLSKYENISEQEVGKITMADDLNNIDDLIGDILVDELGATDEF